MNFQSLLHTLKESISISQLISVVNITLVGSVAWIAGDLGSSVIENEIFQVPREEVRYQPPQSGVTDRPRRFSEFSEILDNNVFNVKVSEPKEVKAEPVKIEIQEITPGEVLQEIMNDLQLVGIHYRKGYYIYCILKSKRKNSEEIFTINDEVFDTGAVVDRIFTTFGNQRVHLRLGDEIGILRSDDDESGKDKPKAIRASKRRKAKPQPAKKSQPEQNPAIDSEYSEDGKNFYISATEVDSHLNNFGTLLNQARMVPYFNNGEHQGFRVKAIDKGSLYEKLGLQNNDIIKAVNGESLAEAGGEKLMGLFKLLRNEREFTVEIERDSSPQVLTYYVN